MNKHLLQPLCALALVAASQSAAADSLGVLRYAVSGGAPNLDARLRYERVDQDDPVPARDRAEALTLRLRLGYTTGKWNDTDAAVEYEYVGAHHYDEYDLDPSPAIGDNRYSVIADPEGAEINQAWLRYAGIPGTVLKYGRQRIVFDNARFVGNVGWRQNEQTYDGLLLTNTSLPKTTLNYAHLSNINSFKLLPYAGGADADVDVDAHLLNAAFAPAKFVALSAYAYLLDFNRDATPTGPVAAHYADTQTLGLRASGTVPFEAFNFLYAVEYADQSDYQDSASTTDASYALAELGGVYAGVTAKLGYEVLGGDGVYAFQTPLATLHAFQGWSDQFLVTPLSGIKDRYLSVGGTACKLAMLAVWHDYRGDEGGGDLGSELNLQATYPVFDGLMLGAKYADYDDGVDTAASVVDTKKAWLWAEYKF